MSDLRCEGVRDLIPDLVAGRLEASEARLAREHLAACPSCAGEEALVALLHQGRPTVPEELADRIRGAIASLDDRAAGAPMATPRRPGGSGALFPWWGLAAAAVAAVALGIGVQVHTPAPGADLDIPAFAVEGEDGELWLSGDGEIAGAPTLDDLTEDELRRFLEELDGGGVA